MQNGSRGAFVEDGSWIHCDAGVISLCYVTFERKELVVV